MLNAAVPRAVFVRYMTAAEERQLYRHIGMHATYAAMRDRAWMQFVRHTGIRIGSMSRMTCADGRQALAENLLTVRSDIAKGKHGYQVPLTKPARSALKALFDVRRKITPEDPDKPLVLSNQGKRLSVRSYQSRMQFWRKRAGLTVDVSPHWLRHTLAMRVMKHSEARDPQGIVQAALGQRSRESTVAYTLPSREDVAAALENCR